MTAEWDERGGKRCNKLRIKCGSRLETRGSAQRRIKHTDTLHTRTHTHTHAHTRMYTRIRTHTMYTLFNGRENGTGSKWKSKEKEACKNGRRDLLIEHTLRYTKDKLISIIRLQYDCNETLCKPGNKQTRKKIRNYA